MRVDSTFVNMKDVDITDQGPDTGNNDIAVLRGAGWGRSGGWRGSERRTRGRRKGRGWGEGGPRRPQGLSAISHTDRSIFLRGRTNLHYFASIESAACFLFLFQ